MNFVLFLTITAALPLAWLISDITARPSIRRALGIVTILWSFAVAAIVGLLQNFNANSYFTDASKDLLTASVEQMKAGKTEVVLREWLHADDQFHATYENRGKYRQIVDEAIAGMKKP
jgi:hypothetical protein